MKNNFSLTRLFTLLFFSSLSLGQLQRFQLTPNIAFYLHDILLGFIYLFSLKHTIKFLKSIKKISNLTKSFLVFFVILILSLAFWIGRIDILIGSLYLFRFLYYSFSIPTFIALRKEKIIKYSLHQLLIYLGLALMTGGLIQRIFIPDTRNYILLGWDDHLYRSIGTLLDPNFLGLLLILTLFPLLQSKLKYKKQFILLILLTILFTYSRSTYLAFILSFIVLAFQKKNYKIIALVISIILIGAILLPKPGGEGVKLLRTSSIITRINSQKRSLQIFMEKPLLGIGFNNYKEFLAHSTKYDFVPSHPSGPDNSFLLILITTGIIGFSSFLFIFYQLIKKHYKDQIILPSITAISIHSLFNNSLFYAWILLWIFILFSERISTERT